MTLVSQLITDAYRESNLTAINAAPSAAEEQEALRLLNRILKASIGSDMGDMLENYLIGTNNIDQSYTGDNQYIPDQNWFIPRNKRLILNLNEGLTLNLLTRPEDGTRFGVVDGSSNLDTNNLLIKGNGALIEGATELTLSTPGISKTWFYRSDLNDWKLVSGVGLTDEWPFPEEFDDLFTISLAMRINPRNDASIESQGGQAYKRSLKQFKARYSQKHEVGVDIGLLRLTSPSSQVYLNTFNRG